MKSPKTEKLIEKYIENELDEIRRREFEKLLKRDPGLLLQVKIAGLIKEEAVNIPIRIPAPDWKAVEARLQASRSRIAVSGQRRRMFIKAERLLPLAGALAALMIVTISLFVIAGLTYESFKPMTPNDKFIMLELQAAEKILKTDLYYLQKQLASNIDQLPDELKAMLNREKALIDKNIEKSRELLKSDPRNALARNMLFDNYKLEIKLYRSLFEFSSDYSVLQNINIYEHNLGKEV